MNKSWVLCHVLTGGKVESGGHWVPQPVLVWILQFEDGVVFHTLCSLNRKAVRRFLFKVSSFCFSSKLCSWIEGIRDWAIAKFIWQTKLIITWDFGFAKSGLLRFVFFLYLFFDVEAEQREAYSFKTATTPPLTSQTQKNPSWYRCWVARGGLISVCAHPVEGNNHVLKC